MSTALMIVICALLGLAWLLAMGVTVMFFMGVKELERRGTEPDVDRERVGIDNGAWSA